MAHHVPVQGPDHFDAVLGETIGKLSNEHDTFYVYFFSDWCPDCHKADPLVREEMTKQTGKLILDCNVGAREPYKKPDHPYRLHNQIKLTAIPTLIRWGKDGPKERLVEADCYDRQKLVHFLAGAH